MFWKLSTTRSEDTSRPAPRSSHGRFVLHRHHDANGPHLDLRVEMDGHLAGFRVDALSLDGETWASEKGPHPIDWLERDGDAVREDAGVYVRESISDDEMRLTLHGADGIRVIHALRDPGLAPSTVRDICNTLRSHNARATDAPKFIADGIAARRRAIERLCGLARELDGAAFDEEVCKRALVPLTLEDIHAQLRGYELRFDAKYPPAPVSRPERLCGHSDFQRTNDAISILRDDDRSASTINGPYHTPLPQRIGMERARPGRLTNSGA